MTRNEELEQMELEAREKQKNAQKHIRKKRINLRKAIKRSAIRDVGFMAASARGLTQAADLTFKGALFMVSPDETLLGFADEFAGQFGGYTKHSVGDKMFGIALKQATNLEKFAVKTILKATDYSEKKLKNGILHARLGYRVR